MKRFVLRASPWVALFVLLIILGILLLSDAEVRGGSVGAPIAAILGLYYFAQRQRLAETALFKDLFSHFNDRYDKLNDALMRLSASDDWSDQDKCKVVDYLNLCAEEYLFFKRGYIVPEVWQAWCRGMQQYLEVPQIAQICVKELATRSYYGLSQDIIAKGAK
jgi:hypothetical protein